MLGVEHSLLGLQASYYQLAVLPLSEKRPSTPGAPGILGAMGCDTLMPSTTV